MLLDPQALAKLSSVKLRARAVVEGVLSGLHKSPHQGQSVEFAEHKEYAPGDEIRHIDWKAFGKFDKYYVKRYEHETNLRAYLAIDASASMNYRSGDLSKLDVATMLAASLAYLLIRQQDAVGLLILKASGTQYIPPRSSASHLQAILEALEGLKGEGPTRLAAAADLLSEKAQRRSAVVLLSDLFDEDPKALARLLQLRLRKNDVSVFQVLDRAELEFPFEDHTLFLSMEDERQQQASPREIRESYLEEIRAFLDQTKRSCFEMDCYYEAVRTDEAMDRALLRYLGRRENGRRGKS
ncbi:MAG: DUF58 domain-containing protein [Deltaproteobacteria bacterium]|nr:DUF58 domain-containing protein [Deltaproteobacteria bacterium]